MTREGEPRDPVQRLDFADLYGTGAAIGMTPRQIDDLTPWEFVAAVEGWRIANCPEPPPAAPSDAEHDAMVEKYG